MPGVFISALPLTPLSLSHISVSRETVPFTRCSVFHVAAEPVNVLG